MWRLTLADEPRWVEEDKDADVPVLGTEDGELNTGMSDELAAALDGRIKII